MMRASSPSEESFLAQWCALELASIATTQPAGSCAHQPMNLSLASARPVTSWPAASTACTWITRLARSTPTRTTTLPHSPRVICSTDFPLQWLEIDDLNTTNLGATTPLPKVGSPFVFRELSSNDSATAVFRSVDRFT